MTCPNCKQQAHSTVKDACHFLTDESIIDIMDKPEALRFLRELRDHHQQMADALNAYYYANTVLNVKPNERGQPSLGTIHQLYANALLAAIKGFPTP